MIFDLHNDILTSCLTKAEKISALTQSSQRLSGIVCALWTTKSSSLPVPDFKIPKRTYFAIEDMTFFDFALSEQLLSLSPLYCGLTWNYDNEYAGGALGSGRLTARGKRLVAFLNNNKIAVDTAHLNEKSFYDVVSQSGKVLNSHTSLYALKKHERNLNARQIRLLIERDGIVGLTPVAKFCDDYFAAIDSFAQNYGVDNLAIGTDFFGADDFAGGYSSYDKLFSLFERLLVGGYSESDINKIFSKNAIRFFFG